jgi:hypothetical protein
MRLERIREAIGNEIAEAALILPMLFMLLFSIYWFGRAFSIHSTINHAAREGARTAATPTCANCSSTSTWQNSALPDDSTVVGAVDDLLCAAHVDPGQVQPYQASSTPGCLDAIPTGTCVQVSTAVKGRACPSAGGGEITICRNVALNPASSAPACGVVVSFQYPYQFPLPLLPVSKQKILLKAQGEMGVEE